MGTLRIASRAPGQGRGRPAPSPMMRAFERAHGRMARRVTREDRVSWLESLGLGHGGMLPATAECAASIQRTGRQARHEIASRRAIAWRQHCVRRGRSRRPRARARRHRVSRRTAAKATADPEGPEPPAPFARSQQGAR